MYKKSPEKDAWGVLITRTRVFGAAFKPHSGAGAAGRGPAED